MQTPNRPAIYARISEDRTGAGLGVERQVAECRDLAARRGWPEPTVYADNDISAWDRKHQRPSYKRLLADIEHGSVDGLLTWHLDRLTRRPAELEQFFDVCDQAGMRHMATVSGDIDLATRDGQFHARILAAVARKSSDDASARLKARFLQISTSGGHHGGPRPYGYEPDGLTVRESEAEHVREAARRILAGESVLDILKDWNSHGVKPAHGKLWTHASLKRMITGPRVAGLSGSRTDGQVRIVGEAQWPAIIDRETWEAVRYRLEAKARSQRPPRRYFLSGLVHCSLCGSLMRSQYGRNRRRYACMPDDGTGRVGCGKVSIDAERLEEIVEVWTAVELADPKLRSLTAEPGSDVDVERATTELTALRGRQSELGSLFASGVLDGPALTRANADLAAKVTELERQLAQRSDLHILAHGPIAVTDFLTYPVSRKAEIARALIDRIEVKPNGKRGPVFDPSRVAVHWKHRPQNDGHGAGTGRA